MKLRRRKTSNVVNTHEAKTHLSRLLARVERGEEIVIAKAGKPVARLMPLRSADRPRRPGGAEGLMAMSADFNAPLPAEFRQHFE